MKQKYNPKIDALNAIIEQQERTIDRLTKELQAREEHIQKLYGTNQTYTNITEIIKLLKE